MKNKTNIAEFLKDCPKGTKLYSPLFGEVEFDCIEDGIGIKVDVSNGCTEIFYSNGRFYNGFTDAECLLFPSKDQRDWSKFVPPCKFKDGDVLVHTQNGRFIMSIYKSTENEKLINTHVIFWDREEGLSVGMQICCYTDNVRFATKEEKAKLFQAIKDNGYKWNEETKSLEKLINKNKFVIGAIVTNGKIKGRICLRDGDSYVLEDGTHVFFNEVHNWELVSNKFDINTLKPFDKVLVRHNIDNKWCSSFFSHIDSDFHSHCYKFVTIAGKSYPMCIPFEGNEHLSGATNNCIEYYKTWE